MNSAMANIGFQRNSRDLWWRVPVAASVGNESKPFFPSSREHQRTTVPTTTRAL